MTKKISRFFLALFLGLLQHAYCQMITAPAYSSARVHALAKAIARAEGYGIPGAIPTRFNNPGDLMATRGVQYPGQSRITPHGYVVFATPADGWAALEDQIVRVIQGRSRHYTLQTTLQQMARTYAENWRPWVKLVSGALRVPGSITLEAYLTGGDVDVPLQISYPSVPFAEMSFAR